MKISETTVETETGLSLEKPVESPTPEEAKETTKTFVSATRIQESVTSGVERKALVWMANRMPLWVTSDQLTLLGFAAMFLAGCSYLLARWHPIGLLLATVCLVVNWFGDSLDGTLARVRNRQRPRYGFYVDHIVDSFGALFLMTGLGLSGYVDWRLAMGMLIAFLLLSIETYLASYALGIFRLSFAKFGPTEIRILLALGNFVLWFRPNTRAPAESWRLLDFSGVIAITVMGLIAVVAAVRHTAELYAQESLK
jgi:archaetidylinositol phosphate synthase